MARQRLGEVNEALQDAASVERRAPEWVIDDYIRAMVAQLDNDADAGIAAYGAVIEGKPDDWFPYNMRGWFHYLKGDYEAATADYAQALALEPNTNFPYIVSGLVALRQGRMAEARHFFDTVLTDYPDPTFANRLIRTAFGEPENDIIGPMFSAVGNFILKQYDQMLVDTQKALEAMPDSTDLLVMEGFAYCNLGDYERAEAAYDRAIALEPDEPFPYMLRGDVRLKRLNLGGANADAARVRELVAAGNGTEEMLVYLDAGLTLQVGCQNFFEWIPPG
jgi:tetratricopeptide (TPR) repeat protein